MFAMEIWAAKCAFLAQETLQSFVIITFQVFKEGDEIDFADSFCLIADNLCVVWGNGFFIFFYF